MFRRSFLVFLCTLLAATSGCEKTEKITLPPVQISESDVPSVPAKAQPKLPVLKLWIGSQEIEAELAATFDAVQTGMMFRTNMAENAGMLFVFGRPHQASFWMKNTFVPLSIGYIDPDGKLLETYDMTPLDTNSVTAKSGNIQYVLEVNQGWFERNNIKAGSIVRTERGTLRDTFFRRP